MSLKLFICCLVASFALIGYANSHGYLAEPPARSSAWLFDRDFTECCSYFNHMEMFCGGTETLWKKNGGKCGICGENWNSTKLFEKGGKMYLGKIVRNYTQGDSINISVVITANHYGYFEFRICNIDGWKNDATQTCLNKTLLNVTKTNENKFYIANYSSPSIVKYKVDLPPNLVCRHCVLQWKYVTGNRWGYDRLTNTECLGCGVIQEQFFGCSDIAILPKNQTSSTEIYPTVSESDNEDVLEVVPETTPSSSSPSSSSPSSSSSSSSSSSLSSQSTIDTTTKSIKIDNSTTSMASNTVQLECENKLPFDSQLDLSTVISIYCTRVCIPNCYEKDTKNTNNPLCIQTCPALCKCNTQVNA